MANAVEGLIRAAERAQPGDRSLPRWLARALAAGGETLWRGLRLRGAPPLTRTAVCLIGEGVTVDDSWVRRELGYREVISREEGRAALRAAA